MKKVLTAAIAATLVSVIAFSAPQAKSLKGWSSHPEGYPGAVAMQKFGEIVKKAFPDKFDYKVYLSMTLGDENSAIDQTRFGVIDYSVFSLGPLSDTIEELKFLSLPYIFKSPEHMYRVMDGELGQEFSKIAEKYGLVILGWHGAGARSFYTRETPIKTPDDLKGLKIRVQKSQVMADTMAALGATPTPLPFTEVFTAIKTGVVDGAENNWPSYESTGHYEVAPYYSLDMHSILPEVLVVSKILWESLSDAEKAVFIRAGKESTELQRAMWAEREKKSQDIVIKAGTKVTKADVPAFQKKVGPVLDKYLNDQAKAFVKRINAVD